MSLSAQEVDFTGTPSEVPRPVTACAGSRSSSSCWILARWDGAQPWCLERRPRLTGVELAALGVRRDHQRRWKPSSASYPLGHRTRRPRRPPTRLRCRERWRSSSTTGRSRPATTPPPPAAPSRPGRPASPTSSTRLDVNTTTIAMVRDWLRLRATERRRQLEGHDDADYDPGRQPDAGRPWWATASAWWWHGSTAGRCPGASGSAGAIWLRGARERPQRWAPPPSQALPPSRTRAPDQGLVRPGRPDHGVARRPQRPRGRRRRRPRRSARTETLGKPMSKGRRARHRPARRVHLRGADRSVPPHPLRRPRVPRERRLRPDERSRPQATAVAKPGVSKRSVRTERDHLPRHPVGAPAGSRKVIEMQAKVGRKWQTFDTARVGRGGSRSPSATRLTRTMSTRTHTSAPDPNRDRCSGP